MMMMGQHVAEQSYGFFLDMSIGMVMSHCVQGRGNAAMLRDVLLCPMVHAQSPQCTEGRTLHVRMRMMVVHRLDNSMNSIRVGNAFFVNNGASKVPESTA